MASLWHKAMVYLGLGPDEEYDDYPERGYPGTGGDLAGRDLAGRDLAGRELIGPEPSVSGADPRRVAPRAVPTGTVIPQRTPVSGYSTPPDEGEVGSVRPIPVRPEDAQARVRAVPRRSNVRPHLVRPSSFNHAQEIADKFKAQQPVAVTLDDVDRELGRRLIDFSSGLCYGLGGDLKKVDVNIYLLIPAGAQVPDEERARLADRFASGD